MTAPAPPKKAAAGPRRSGRGGFSLVEVVFALGLVSFVLVGILGLFTVGLGSVKDSEMKLEAANVAAIVLEQRLSAPSATSLASPLPPIDPATLPDTPPAEGTSINIDATGSPAAADARFKLTYRIWRQSGAGSPTPLVRLHLFLSWPPEAPQPEDHYEVMTSVFAE